MDSSLSDAFKRVLSLHSNDIDVSVLEKVLEIIETSINDEGKANLWILDNFEVSVISN